MLALIDLILTLVAALLLLPVAVFAVQVLAACLARPLRPGKPPQRGPVVILMPAHDEAVVIRDTLQRLKPHLQSGDRVLVVADNCSDDTAAIARSEGAEVTERFNTSLRGKGYALDHGVRALAQNPPACVVIVDADCELAEGALNWLADSVARTGRPTQALYLMNLVPGSRAVSPVAVFAWRVRNLVRPLGLHVLGGPCHLTGSGMALPWPLIRDLPLASGHIVEDMKMGVDLARAGFPPLFCRPALVTSTFAVSREGAQAQRTRWEHGTLGMILSEVPKMLAEGLRGRGRGLLPLALDMVPPPLALLAILLLFVSGVTFLWHILCMPSLAFGLALGETTVFGLALMAAWWRFGRDIVSATQVPALVAYTLGKLPIYLGFLVKRQMVWVRSKRDSD
jgi:cellulose synthase/poly-beta-1,6-N-acetylglucosamine synthase-like glycosyltransferase